MQNRIRTLREGRKLTQNVPQKPLTITQDTDLCEDDMIVLDVKVGARLIEHLAWKVPERCIVPMRCPEDILLEQEDGPLVEYGMDPWAAHAERLEKYGVSEEEFTSKLGAWRQLVYGEPATGVMQ